MKIIAVRGKNLASLEDYFELDFTVEPLASAGIFAITGQTGSGKSTILDALCLALFDDTPRLHNAKEVGVEIPDTADKTLRQDDCRTILRRGTAEGYAEVDFLSLGGERFRTKWFVNRMRGKVDGSLSMSTITLTNLSAREEVRGTKKEILACIVKLIGLSFEQFTRAVLLAQGDFSTFLKAKGKEKAELLEKLTGTEIYSRISSLIYEHAKSIEQEYKTIRMQIQDIELLDEAEIQALLAEQHEHRHTLKELETKLKTVEAEIKWINDKDVIVQHVAEAEDALRQALSAIADAKPRYAYIAQIDSVQAIRDVFIQLQEKQKQLTENQSAISEKQAELKREYVVLEEENKRCIELENQLKIIDDAFTGLEPEMRKAQDLDIQIVHAGTDEANAREDYDSVLRQKAAIEQTIRTLAATLKSKQETADTYLQWKAENIRYEEIIVQFKWIVQSLDAIRDAGKNIEYNQQLYAQEIEMRKSDHNRMLKLKSEQERLNQLLPAEIALIRATLREGVPCPVCGSLHHPAGNASGESSLEEKELTKKKQLIADEMMRLSETIEQRNNKITQLSTLMQTYGQQRDEKRREIEVFMHVFPSWWDDVDTGVVQEKIKQLAKKWTQCEEIIKQTEQEIAILKIKLDSENDKLSEATEQLTAKSAKSEAAAQRTVYLKNERALLLRGNSVDDLKKRYETKKRSVDEQFKLSKKKQDEQSKKIAGIQGFIARIEQACVQLSDRYASLLREKEAWASTQQDVFTDTRLEALFANTAQWIEAERQLLIDLKTNENVARVTLEERKTTLDKHDRSEIKPADAETKTRLEVKKEKIEQQLPEKRNREVTITVVLENNRKNEALRKRHEQQLAEKGYLCENWCKLNELLGSASGDKFKKIAQEYTLDFLLVYANTHLRELTQRYDLQRIPDTLALQVIDMDMFNEIRSVHSLSGGESFLVSLALALGLSSLSSNRMKIESLFIDEGFGSLDAGTLRIAMDALENLQTQGRKIGVISHVEEMTERIVTQVRIVKSANGKSVVTVAQAL